MEAHRRPKVARVGDAVDTVRVCRSLHSSDEPVAETQSA
jgi:hypothetical protein